MFKNIIDSFFIIDAKEKPSPSFLFAYIFTWVFCNYEISFAFFKTSGDLTERFNASLNTPIDWHWFSVLLMTFLFVVSRFLLNSAIYYIRELIDYITQKKLEDNGHKSFKSHADYQKLSAKVSSLQNDLLSSQDREKAAKAAENEATSATLDLTIEKDTHQAKFESQVAMTKNVKKELQETKLTLQDFQTKNANLEIQVKQFEEIQESLAIKHKESREHIYLIKQRLKHWARNAGDGRINLIGSNVGETDSEMEIEIENLLNAKISYKDYVNQSFNTALAQSKLLSPDPLDKAIRDLVSK